MQSATGFGDYYPVTYIGRAFTTISAMFGGLLLVALIQSLFFGVLELSPKEQKVKHLIDTDRWEKATQQNAASLLQRAWKCHAEEKKNGGQQRSPTGNQRRLFELMCVSRSLRNAQPMMTQSTEDHFVDMEDAVLAQMDQMEHEKAAVLQRIHAKATQLGALKLQLEAQKSKTT